MAALLSRIPLKAREKTMIAAPLFHAWGFAHFTLGMGLSSTIVLKRKFDEEATLSLTAQHGCTALVVVPVMLQRILELDDEVLDRYDLSHVKAVPVSGSALPGSLERALDGPLRRQPLQPLRLDRGRVGDDRHARRTCATRPGTAGKPPRGTVVRIYDDDGQPVEDGETGRIFVGNDLQFEGYTGGGNKDVIDGLMSSGDVGHFDDERAPVRRRPRRRHDRLGRRERLPAGGRGAARGPRLDQGGRGLRRRRREVRPAAEGRRGHQGQKMSADEVKKYVKTNLAGYKVPRDVEFVDELPRTSTGKVLKRELKDD